ncbi:MAG: TonB-dependent receptor [Bacteroidetes bacterium]|nr:TonB-dependent receptor [Bacteroidota bacterium]MBU1117065.1 TonB-dependent receptor [Bacteroidota bacterium]MBU1797660.1 TonB-dependent receptor [Bacteroidota bacterium]
MQYKRIKLFLFLFLSTIIFSASFIQAQGTIKGKVLDKKGEALIGVNVYLLGTSLGDATNMEGDYNIKQIPMGKYNLQVSMVGYKKAQFEITISGDETIKQDVVLQEDILNFESVIVTGTAGGSGIKKKDASFAITTISAVELEQLSPPSTAAALELVPGVWSESSGGVAGANIFVRGLPSGGDAPFVTMSINGAPIYGTQTLSFFEQSTLFRIDETVGSTEAVKGGPSSVFSNGEAGLTTNFNLKKGTDQTLGRVKYSTTDYSQQRVDAVLSGALSEKLYYMVGGYLTTSPGIRNTEFNSEKGQQITFQLTKVFDKGVLNGFSRLTDDHGQWVLPMSLGTGNDPGTFSPLGNATRFRTLQINTQGDLAQFDFSKGRGWKGVVSGLNFDYDLGDSWTVRDNLSFTSGNADTYGLVPNGSAMSVADLSAKLGNSPIKTVGGRTLTSGFVQSYGFWVVQKELQSLTNDISISKIVGDHNLTIGSYQAFWSTNDFWTLGNHALLENVTNGELIKDVSADNVSGSWNYGLYESGDSRMSAIYLGDSWQINEKLRLDLGARYQFFTLNFTLDAGALPDGTIDKTADIDAQDWAGTAAVNYELNNDLGVFLRGSKGSLFPYFDQIRENTFNLKSGTLGKDADGNITSVTGTVSPNIFNQFELGAKFEQDLFSLFITGFFNTVDVFDGGVGSTWDAASLKTRTFGAEVDGGLNVGALRVRLLATFQKGEITESASAPETVGKSIWRQPDLQLRLAPSYNFQLSANIDASVYGAIRYVGSRWNDRGNTYQLDPFTKIDLGVNLTTLSGLTFNLSGDNLTDSEGLTEGDPRDPIAKNGRPIFGRSLKFAITIDF